ncbi:hypothetical protein BZL41_00150 [Pseudomonas sp. PIC25]|nr:hypothetical protein BZL41_00150 [Pseudomonas sp. PIC25]
MLHEVLMGRAFPLKGPGPTREKDIQRWRGFLGRNAIMVIRFADRSAACIRNDKGRFRGP